MPAAMAAGKLLLQVLVEEGEHGLLGRLGVLPLEAVAGPFQRQQLGLDAGGLELLDQPLACSWATYLSSVPWMHSVGAAFGVTQ